MIYYEMDSGVQTRLPAVLSRSLPSQPRNQEAATFVFGLEAYRGYGVIHECVDPAARTFPKFHLVLIPLLEQVPKRPVCWGLSGAACLPDRHVRLPTLQTAPLSESIGDGDYLEP